ncbi:hypothetical protein AKJ09_08582 [Labilithrix luteola]|uniref:Uncharacterized protein n=1 Tax=Labilithrix luteola TaxID=1391654 RepID=A0A0K1Q865_9BACT|nr:hypothetical protein AKJ09_08582 [Labilithrix luteola]
MRRFEALARRCGDRMTAARLAMVCMSALVLAAAGSAFALARPQAPDVPAPIAESAPVDARIDARVEPRVEVDANMGANTGANDSAGARVHRKPTAAPRAASAARAGRR